MKYTVLTLLAIVVLGGCASLPEESRRVICNDAYSFASNKNLRTENYGYGILHLGSSDNDAWNKNSEDGCVIVTDNDIKIIY